VHSELYKQRVREMRRSRPGAPNISVWRKKPKKERGPVSAKSKARMRRSALRRWKRINQAMEAENSPDKY